jgi:hypothetical protein
MPLDDERIELLARRFLDIVRSNYVQGPTGRDRVFEALNALAIAVAFVMAGTDGDDAAQEFFNTALENQIETILDRKS